MVARRKKSEVPRERKGATKKVRPRRTRMHKAGVPQAQAECEIVSVYFEIDDEVVSVIDGELNRIPIFPSHRIGGLPSQHSRVGDMPASSKGLVGRLREAIITVMSDLEAEDNGIV